MMISLFTLSQDNWASNMTMNGLPRMFFSLAHIQTQGPFSEYDALAPTYYRVLYTAAKMPKPLLLLFFTPWYMYIQDEHPGLPSHLT